MVWEEMSFEEFQDVHHGGHLGYQNRMILAILNLCVAVMPPIKFWLNRTYGLGDRHSTSVVVRPLCNQEVAGSIPGRVIPKTLKMLLAALSFYAQH